MRRTVTLPCSSLEIWGRGKSQPFPARHRKIKYATYYEKNELQNNNEVKRYR